MKIDMYVLGLLKFKKDEFVFSNKELDKIKNKIGEEGLRQQEQISMSKPQKSHGWSVYHLQSHVILPKKDIKLKSVKLGYYHHRVIVWFSLSSEGSFSELRKIRDEFKKEADKLIEQYVQRKINALVHENEISDDGKVEFFYTYPLIAIKDSKKNRKKVKFPFSEQTTSMCFDIIEPSALGFSVRRHVVRISIPGTIIYFQKKINESLKRDLLNAIYQHCLYQWKLRDQHQKNRKTEHPLDEEILTRLWMHMIEKMGGRPIDVYTLQLSNTALILAILAIILALLTKLVEAVVTQPFF